MRRRSTISFSDARSASVTKSKSPLVSNAHATFKMMGQQCAGFARNFDGSLQELHAAGGLPSAFFLDVLDVVLEDEQVRVAVTSQPDEGLIVILDRPQNFFAVFHLHADGSGILT